MEEPEDLLGREPVSGAQVRAVLDVTDAPVSPASVATQFCHRFSLCSDWEFVEPQSFSFSNKRAHSCAVTQEEMRFESSQVKSSRRLMPPTRLQNSYSSFEEEQSHFEVQDQIWSARDRTVMHKKSTWKKVKV